ncbi:MAG: YfhO family protein [Chloroflexi bacterium]|nr:YfhO family protein [Chloroflexota bacterium]
MVTEERLHTLDRCQECAAALWVAAALLVATLATYQRFAFGQGVPGGYDTQTYFFPYHAAVARSLLSGRFPLWDRDLFLGAPLFANIQSAVLYPPNVLFLFVSTPRAFSILIIAHVWWAAWGLALLARRTWNVSWFAALGAGVAFGLGGFFSAQAGHLNQISAASWLPWLLLALDQSWQRRSWQATAIAAVIVAVQFLAGHTQETYYLLCVAAGWILWRFVQQLSKPRNAFLTASSALLAASIGILLTGIQLAPTYELAQQSIRSGGLPIYEASSFSLPLGQLAIEILPGYSHQPASTEYNGYVGLIGLTLAIIGLITAWRRPGTRFLFILVIIGISLAAGLHSPIWRLAFHFAPGFASFRVPARALYISTFGLALLVGLGSDWLIRRSPRLSLATGVMAAIVGLAAAFAGYEVVIAHPAKSIVLSQAPAAIVLVSAMLLTLTKRLHTVGLAALFISLAGELVVAASWLPPNQPVAPQVYSDEQQTVSLLRGHPAYGRVLSIARTNFQPGDERAREQIGTRTVGAANAIQTSVWLKLQQILAPNLPLAYGIPSADGYDGGILPLRNYVILKSAFLPSCPICRNPDSLLREELSSPPALAWLHLLDIGALVNDRLQDFHFGPYFADMTFHSRVSSGNSLIIHLQHSHPATAVAFVVSGGKISHLHIDIHLADRTQLSYASTSGTGTSAFAVTKTGVPLRDDPSAHGTLIMTTLPERSWVTGVEVKQREGITINAITLVDALTGADWQIPPVPGARVQRIFEGDVAVYHIRGSSLVSLYGEMKTAQSDTAIVHDLKSKPTQLRHLLFISYPDFPPIHSLLGRIFHRAVTILNGDPHLLPSPPPADCHGGSIATRQQETSIAIHTSCSGSSYLLIRQAWYPGWHATVDGQRVPIYRADIAFQAVAVPAGEHQVRVWYHPASLELGGFISVLAIMALASLPWSYPRLVRAFSR